MSSCGAVVGSHAFNESPHGTSDVSAGDATQALRALRRKRRQLSD